MKQILLALKLIIVSHCVYLIVTKFVELMDPLNMREEWRYITMVNGLQCVITGGIFLLHKLCVDHWVLHQQLLLEQKHIMKRVASGLSDVCW